MGQPSDESTEKRAGLEPEEFQKRLLLVTFTVLGLGVVGGTCLGYKIDRAERLQEKRANQESPAKSPAEPRNRPSEDGP